MSYGEFLAFFLCVPLVVLGVLARAGITRQIVALLAGVSLVALLYTAPWDNLIVVNGVWSYGRHKILGVVIGHVPLEEYVFYVLQVWLTGLATLVLIRTRVKR